MKLEPYLCKQCGGRINVAKMVCEYCGTAYHDESLKRIKIVQVRPGEHLISAQIEVDIKNMIHYPEDTRDYALHELRNQIADGLLGYMKVTTSESFNPGYFGRTEIIRGEVRVIDPVFNGG